MAGLSLTPAPPSQQRAQGVQFMPGRPIWLFATSRSSANNHRALHRCCSFGVFLALSRMRSTQQSPALALTGSLGGTVQSQKVAFPGSLALGGDESRQGFALRKKAGSQVAEGGVQRA